MAELLAVGAVFALVGGVVFYACAEPLFSMYTNNPDVLPELSSLKLPLILNFELSLCTAVIDY